MRDFFLGKKKNFAEVFLKIIFMQYSKFTFLNCLFVGTLSFVLFTSNSGGYPSDRSGSPIVGGATCASCHGGGAGGGSVTLTGAPSSYTYGTGYAMNLTMTGIPTSGGSGGIGGTGGFQIAAVSSSNTYIGTFVASSGTNVLGYGGLSHNAPKAHSGGSVSWIVNWTAPVSGNNQVKFYYVGNAADDTGDTSGDDIYTGTSAFIPLPVRLLGFEAQEGTNDVELSWQTASEENTRSFVVERKSSDDAAFSAISTITAKGTTQTPQHYSFRDVALENTTSIFYYRLKIVDNDGEIEYSATKSVKINHNNAVSIYPTVLSETAILSIFQEKNIAKDAFILDASGKTVQHTLLTEGRNDIEISLPIGQYFVKVGSVVKSILVLKN
ncbi:MAG: hypothetical protein RLZZ292_2362 [Bacteroidota bacterium]